MLAIMWKLLIVSCVVLISAATARAEPELDTVRVGVLAYRGSERAAHDWEPTLSYLERAIPGRRFVMMPLDLAGMVLAVADRQVDFVITNPGSYVTLEARFAVTRIATLESGTPDTPIAAVGSTVIRRADRAGIGKLADLKGKRLAVVSTDAFGGFQIAWREMEEAGVRPFTDLAELTAVGFPMEGVVEAVRAGSADAGVLRACLLEEMTARGRIAPNEFVVVGEKPPGELPCRVSSRLYPDWPFARLAHTPRDLARRVAAALLTMPETEGPTWTASLDYTSVHELFRTLHIGPYPKTPPTLEEVLKENWQWLAVIAAAVLWWVVHSARVEVLVRRRTAELEREIAERERAEATALRLREERDQLSRLGIVGEMASNIAHELNQPLAAIGNFAGGMTRILDAPTPDLGMLRAGARSVAEQAERAAAIIQRTRGFVSRRDAQRSALSVNAVVEETLSLFGAPPDPALSILTEPADGLPEVRADKVELQQVLLNLLQNAVEATRTGNNGGGEIVLRTALSGGMVLIEVRDSGPGAPEESRRRMFEPFFTTKPGGLGLGLSICRTIVERHGGRIWAVPGVPRGLAVRFTLPPAAGETVSSLSVPSSIQETNT
ncbi:two-component system, LuxR family, sensor histidine kinase TtrS [Azospirillum oryzae]|uniref:histidine kinase n=1 Tax=Azospirillum oryzae TaxID=286727 RepID=A0A1X7DKA6_9PROT|nr:two-component system, LuxR family, sensor histidine kinase TtrS [Azospirillum oryzae]